MTNREKFTEDYKQYRRAIEEIRTLKEEIARYKLALENIKEGLYDCMDQNWEAAEIAQQALNEKG